MSVVIAKNQTAAVLVLDQLPVPDNEIPASGQVTLTDYANMTEIQDDVQLSAHIAAGDVILNVDGSDLSAADSASYASPPTPAVYGTEYQSETDTSFRSTTSTSFFEAQKLTTPSIPSGTYRIEWTYIWSYNDTGRNFECRVTADNTIQLYGQTDGGSGAFNLHQQEPKDRDGSGDGGTDQRHVTSSWADVTFASVGTHEVDIDIASSGGSVIASVHRTSIAIYRVS